MNADGAGKLPSDPACRPTSWHAVWNVFDQAVGVDMP
jgi:hypothetical protein